ncbi:MAG: hypothetical protein KDK39_04285 [Leptospiraceae bacterium]|nr:hypothetical protein [Leptospiraceae bacterium]
MSYTSIRCWKCNHVSSAVDALRCPTCGARYDGGKADQKSSGVGGFVVLLLLIVGAVMIAFNFLSQWQTYSFPLNYIALYYFAFVFIIVTWFFWIPTLWNFVMSSGLTDYPNFNILLAIITIVFYIGLSTGALYAVFKLIAKVSDRIGTHITYRFIQSLLFGPAVFAALWLLGIWLFTK